ncbi:MAG TPA: type II toxin-antitoxin system RatA family toxin [Gammaproteobacteria bacterium]|nr:type II toxin-antitoxin system RatA family toxin [Gammaproteobacteria bacterium]
MNTVKKSVLVPYTPAQMFKLVDAIEQYSEFVPCCKSTTVHSRTTNEVKASVYFMKGGIQQSFTTLNRLLQDEQIEVRLVQGPFRHLEGAWRFEAVGEGCRVSLNLELEFSSKLISLTVGSLIQKGIESYVEAFCERAKVMYGT